MEESSITNQTNAKEKKTKNISKLRVILVIAFIVIFLIISYTVLRGSYLEYKELGENYIEVFFTNLKYRYSIIGICFFILYFVIYFTNRGIKKGLKPFFEKENKPVPKLPNKSISLIVAAIASVIVGTSIMQKVILYIGNTSFGTVDPIFGMDIAYYMFQKPLIETILFDIVILIIGLTIYSILYHIIAFNVYFDGIDGKMLKDSLLLKKVIRNIRLLSIGVALITVLNTQNILFGRMLTIDGNTEIIGAGCTESTIKLWGYIILAVVIVVSIFKATSNFMKGDTKKVIKNILIVPSYLVILFVVMIGFDLLFVNSNKLDKQKDYLQYNINNTKAAFNINIEEKNLENSGTITEQEVSKNADIINNIAIINKNAVLKSLDDSQTDTGHYSYRNANLAKYNINGEDKIVYVSPREITNKERTYNNKTYEYTHGMGQVIISATDATETGTVQYIQKDITGKDNKIQVSEPRMYFGLEVEDMIATNVNQKQEYDYTDENGNEQTTSYSGKAGLNLSFLDRFILGLQKGKLNLAFSGDVTEESKILINRNVIERAKIALPYLIYDDNPYTVVNNEGRIIWVIDAYTTSSQYPYSQYINIEHDNTKERINYIRNSVKVLIDSYDGTVSYYITDRTDPIAMAYEKIYPTLFKSKDETIPNDISEHFVYPQYLYDIQAQILEIYHNVKPDVLYREDDIWEIAKFNSSNISKSTGTQMESYYTMVKNENNENDLGLVQIYNPKDKQNLISYLVGVTEKCDNKLTLYKFSQDSNSVGPMQLDKIIEEDEEISKELETLNVSGTRVTKNMIIVPIENTLLYVEPIYQTMLNEKSNVPILKKVIIASGNKVAIGNDLNTALSQLLSQYAVDIEIENTDDINGLIDAIIKANNNLTQSSNDNNWEMIGSDIEKLQTLINSLEELRNEEEKNKQNELEQNENGQNIIDNNLNIIDNSYLTNYLN